jgi:F0F1-type ATP synthase assembly protein I
MDEKPRRPDLRRLAEMTSTGLILPSSIAVGLFLGYYLDLWLGTDPWLLIVFTLLGVASGLISLLRAIKKDLKDEPPSQ